MAITSIISNRSANKRRIQFRWVFFFGALVLVTCLMIFSFSAQNAEESGSMSRQFVTVLCEFMYPDFQKYDADQQYRIITFLTLIIRKGAHFTEYLILGQFTFHLLTALPRPKKPLTCAFFAWAFAAFFAATDEFHQSFVPGRAMMFKDVMIDSSGALFGVLIAVLISRNTRKKKSS